jgi:hypothetical protein
MAGMSVFRPGENCWRVEQADEFSIIIDADDYFGAIRRTMTAAERLIFLGGTSMQVRPWVTPTLMTARHGRWGISSSGLRARSPISRSRYCFGARLCSRAGCGSPICPIS